MRPCEPRHFVIGGAERTNIYPQPAALGSRRQSCTAARQFTERFPDDPEGPLCYRMCPEPVLRPYCTEHPAGRGRGGEVTPSPRTPARRGGDPRPEKVWGNQ